MKQVLRDTKIQKANDKMIKDDKITGQDMVTLIDLVLLLLVHIKHKI